MRDMKMRAFYKPLNIMLEPEQIESINFETKTLGVYMEMDGKGYHKLRISDFEIMWSTGLKDRNGKDIYEGDIVKVKIQGGYSNHFCDIECTKTVTYNDTSACWEPFNRCRMWRELGESNLSAVEVIGNIHENPELLGEVRE